MDNEFKHIGIVGTGLIGAGWAAFYAAKGFGVTLYDESATALRAGQERMVCPLDLDPSGMRVW